MAPGWYPPGEMITQAYGFCFTDDRQVVLVTSNGSDWNLPGGQVEADEEARQTLAREVVEEACGRVLRATYLASQHVWDPDARAGPTSHYQSRWWARVRLDDWDPHDETIARRLVPAKNVVATLFWHDKAIAARLLDMAVAADNADRSTHA